MEKNIQEEGDRRSDEDPITRERLYDLVWSEPMIRIAKRFKVSSDYLARVCAQLNVPRPEAGYWAKIAIGKKVPKPTLPDPRPSDVLVWSRREVPVRVHRPRQRQRAELPKSVRTTASTLPRVHRLIQGAKAYFEAGRTSHDSNYLRPVKRLLVDMVVTRPALDKALSFANELFLEFEARGHRVIIVAAGEGFNREKVDDREHIPRNDQNDRYHLWRPGRITVVHVGAIAIGLTIIELSEYVLVRYLNGRYIRESEYVPPKLRPGQSDYTWTTHKDIPTGRICLQAYSPHSLAKWTRQWRETLDRPLDVSAIVRELENSVAVLTSLYEQGKRQAEIEHQRWRAQMEEWRRKEEERRAARALQDSKDELLQLIEAWAATKRLEAFFADAGQRLEGLAPDNRSQLADRLRRARDLIGTTDALERLRQWKAPEER
jgi:hypothetical protein